MPFLPRALIRTLVGRPLHIKHSKFLISHYFISSSKINNLVLLSQCALDSTDLILFALHIIKIRIIRKDFPMAKHMSSNVIGSR